MVKTKVFTTPLKNLKLLADQAEINISENKPLFVVLDEMKVLISNLKESVE